tara:strand:+ start:22 stop:672 length:651 start_codon:yes stop_codon:yes gene_type:complete
MRKILALILMLSPLAVLGADFGKIDVNTKISHEDGIHVGLTGGGIYSFGLAGDGYTFSFNGEDNDMELGVSGVYLSHSDSKNIGVGYGAGVGIFDGGVHYHWMSNGDHVVGGATTLTVGGVGLETSADWNLSASDITGKVGTSLDLWGAEASAVSNWDIDSFAFNGLDFSAGYQIPLSDGISITPVASMGLDEGWGRGDIKISMNMNLSFGGHDEL